jgi:pimeloyl-ACP methyl ester carboxylesterase
MNVAEPPSRQGLSVKAGVTPFHFGDGQAVFGCCHVPRDANGQGVVLCYPMGHEYIRTHRLYRQLSERLASVGFHVLRFDYYGTGDSEGDFEGINLERYVRDAGAAIHVLRERGHVEHVHMAGLRVGATVAALAGSHYGALVGVVLWDPVIVGRAFLEEAIELHNEISRYSTARRPRTEDRDPASLELVGFPGPPAMLDDLQRLDLLSLETPPAPDVLLIDSGNQAGQERYRDHLIKTRARVDYRTLPHQKVWTQDPYQMFLPGEIIQAMVAWISGKR